MTDDEHFNVSEARRFRFDDTETIILNTASQREDGIVLPVPESIKAEPEQVQRKLKRLLKAGLIEEVHARLEDGLWRKDREDHHLTLKLTAEGRRAFDALHVGEGAEIAQQQKESDRCAAEDMGEGAAHGHVTSVTRYVGKRPAKVVSTAGEASAEKTSGKTKPRSRGAAPKGKTNSSVKKPAKAASDTAKAYSKSRPPGKDSKAAQLLAALGRAKGATLDELMKISGWQAHSVRGFLSGTVKKKLRLKLRTEVDDKGARRYQVTAKRAAS